MRPEVESGASVEWVEQHLQFKFLNPATLWKGGKMVKPQFKESLQTKHQWTMKILRPSIPVLGLNNFFECTVLKLKLRGPGGACFMEC